MLIHRYTHTHTHTHTLTHKRVRQCKSGNPYTHFTNHNGKQVGLVLHNHKHREETFHFSVLTHTRWKPDSLHICIQIHITDFFERGSHCISLINLLYRAVLAQIHGDSSATAFWELRVNVCATNWPHNSFCLLQDPDYKGVTPSRTKKTYIHCKYMNTCTIHVTIILIVFLEYWRLSPEKDFHADGLAQKWHEFLL